MHGDDQEDSKPKPKKGNKAPSLEKANTIYNKNKNPKAVYDVDASTVDLNFLDVSNWVVGKTYEGVQTLYSSRNGLVFGRLNLVYKGNNQVQILDDIYDFNLNFSNPIKFSEFISPRNIFTAFGQLNAGAGTEFTFRFHGLNTIVNPPQLVRAELTRIASASF